ncbi:MAG: large conductance mechanosensitive channel protein MscL [Thermoplasmata archaeon]
MGLWNDFKNFALKGNVVQIAVGIVIGLAFQAVITAFVNDVINGIIGIPGKADFSSFLVNVNGSPILYGAFINAVIAFVTIALVIFFLVVRPYEAYQRRTATPPPPVATKECPYCISQVPLRATRCPNCTSAMPGST